MFVIPLEYKGTYAMDPESSGKKRRKPKKGGSGVSIEIVGETPKASSSALIEAYDEVETEDALVLNLWIELEGCDAVPVAVKSNLTIHELKLLLGGFRTLSAVTPARTHGALVNLETQRQQLELLGLRGVRPQQIKMKLDEKSLAPSSKLQNVLLDGQTVRLTVVPSPITSALAPATSYSSNGIHNGTSDSETTRFMLDMRQEIDHLKRRLYSASNKEMTNSIHRTISSSALVTDLSPELVSTEPTSVSNRLEMLEAKLDVKNSTATPNPKISS